MLLAGLLARMVGDGVPALSWLHWLGPFGLLAGPRRTRDDRVAPLLVLALRSPCLAVAALSLAGSRDVGAGRWRGRDRAGRRAGCCARCRAWPCTAPGARRSTWSVGVGAYFLLIGLLATAMLDFLRDNPLFASLAASAGFARLASVQGYAASLFALLAVPVGRLRRGPDRRRRLRRVGVPADAALLPPGQRGSGWATWEAGVVAVGTVVVAGVAGLATWAGATWVGAGLGLGESLRGALSIVPVALLCLGAALLALGWLPSAVLAIGVLPAAGGFLLMVFADSFGWPSWVGGLSPFAHLAAVPAEPMDVAGAVGMLLVAAVMGVAGIAGYARRDLRG